MVKPTEEAVIRAREKEKDKKAFDYCIKNLVCPVDSGDLVYAPGKASGELKCLSCGRIYYSE